MEREPIFPFYQAWEKGLVGEGYTRKALLNQYLSRLTYCNCIPSLWVMHSQFWARGEG